MCQSICNLFKRMRNLFYDVHKWPDDVEAEQVVLRISILIWEMYQSDLEKLSHCCRGSESGVCFRNMVRYAHPPSLSQWKRRWACTTFVISVALHFSLLSLDYMTSYSISPLYGKDRRTCWLSLEYLLSLITVLSDHPWTRCGLMC